MRGGEEEDTVRLRAWSRTPTGRPGESRGSRNSIPTTDGGPGPGAPPATPGTSPEYPCSAALARARPVHVSPPQGDRYGKPQNPLVRVRQPHHDIAALGSSDAQQGLLQSTPRVPRSTSTVDPGARGTEGHAAGLLIALNVRSRGLHARNHHGGGPRGHSAIHQGKAALTPPAGRYVPSPMSQIPQGHPIPVPARDIPPDATGVGAPR